MPVGEAADAVDAADVRGGHGSEGPCGGWQAVAVVQRRGGRARPVREPRPGSHARGNEVQLGDPGEGHRSEVTLELVDGLLRG